MLATRWMMKPFLTYIMASLPQEEYQATTLTIKGKLRDDDLTIEEEETLLC